MKSAIFPFPPSPRASPVSPFGGSILVPWAAASSRKITRPSSASSLFSLTVECKLCVPSPPQWWCLKYKVPRPSLLPLSGSVLHILHLDYWNLISNSTCPNLSYRFPTPNLFHTLLSSSQFMATPSCQSLRPRTFQSSLAPFLHILRVVFPRRSQHPTISHHHPYDMLGSSSWIVPKCLLASFLPPIPVDFQKVTPNDLLKI